MKSLLSVCAAALLSIGSAAWALPPAGEAPQSTLMEATKGPSQVIIWKAMDEDTTVYMMGTVHILNPNIQWKNETFEGAWAEAETVYFEADILSPDAAQAAAPLIMSLGFDQQGKKLADYYSGDEQVTINEAIGGFGMSIETFQNMRPWLAGIQTAQVALQSIGGSAEGGVEMILGKRAMEEGKALRFFETVSEQLEMLASADDEAQAKVFLDGMPDLKNVEGYFADLVGAWYQGENEKLADMISAGVSAAPEVADVLLYDRNEKWAAEIAKVMADEPGTIFIAVGAGHLGGERSVQDYLAEAGISTVRVGE